MVITNRFNDKRESHSWHLWTVNDDSSYAYPQKQKFSNSCFTCKPLKNSILTVKYQSEGTDKTRSLLWMKDERHVSPNSIGFIGIWGDCERLKDIWDYNSFPTHKYQLNVKYSINYCKRISAFYNLHRKLQWV